MKKLEDIPRKDVFETPEGYFDRLPSLIQARVEAGRGESLWSIYFGYSLRFALPVLAMGLAVIFYLRTPAAGSAEEFLATVDSANLVAYLEEGDLNTDDLINEVPLNLDEAEAIQNNSIKEMNVDEADVEYLSNEFREDYF